MITLLAIRKTEPGVTVRHIQKINQDTLVGNPGITFVQSGDDIGDEGYEDNGEKICNSRGTFSSS